MSVEFYGADDGELCFWGVVQLVNNKVKYSSHDSLLLLPAGHCLQFALSQRCVQEQYSNLSVIS